MVPEKKYKCVWNPQKDITTYELALCLPYTSFQLQEIEVWDALDESIKRHFDVSEYDYGKMIRGTRDKLKKIMDE